MLTNSIFSQAPVNTKAIMRPPQPIDSHGTLKGYKTFRCRCDECRAANAAWRRQNYNRKRG